MMGLLMGAISCNDNDEPKRGNGKFTVNTPMINHVYNTSTGTVLGFSSTHNKLTLSASSNGFKGYVDFNEGSLRYTYTTDDGLRIISTIADVFFLKTKTIINYKDTTKSTEMDGTMYQFELAPASSTATIKVMGIVHAKDLKYFINLTGSGAELIPTPNGFTIESENIRTTGVYRNWVDSTSSVVSTTDKYPFKSFNASIDLVNDSFSTSFMMGDSATVSATGSTYPDYSTY